MEVTKEQLEILAETLFDNYKSVQYKVAGLNATVQNGLDNVRLEDINAHQQVTQEIVNELIQLNNQLVGLYNENQRLNSQR